MKMLRAFANWIRQKFSKPKAGSIRIAFLTTNLSRGQTVRGTSTVYSKQGVPMALSPSSWSSDNAAVASIDNTGLVTAVSAGSANITAILGSIKSNVVAVTVAPDLTPASITISPSTLSLIVGKTAQLSAVVANAAGTPL